MNGKAVINAQAQAGRSVFLTAFKVAIFLLLMTKIVSSVYIFFWGMFSIDALTEMLGRWHVDEYSQALGDIVGLSLLPLTFALLTVIAPLVGWWIYSRVEPLQQNQVGWMAAVMYVIGDAAVMMIMNGGLQVFSMISLVMSCLIGLLYVMLFMGLGFNFAKLFRAKL